jgi:UDP-2,3-diacylglucosamine pyrophosphatase LpxH
VITEIQSNKLVIISDLHLGNPFSRAKQMTVEFMNWAILNGYDICINGDGFEIAQVSFSKVARDIPEVLQAMRAATKAGRNLYYVVGNHDIVFENFLNDWGGFKVAPFLNLWSGNSRIRIEHGHLYDPFFVRNPDLYEFATWLGGFALKLHPSLYNLWIKFEKFKSRFRKKSATGILGEHPAFNEAAVELLERGFDTVVFGHTHHAGEVDHGDGKKYFNSGSFMLGTAYIEIVNGRVEKKNFPFKMKMSRIDRVIEDVSAKIDTAADKITSKLHQ